MLRKRIPGRDDEFIFALVDRLLVPFAKETKPELRLNRVSVRRRLKRCITYVDTAAGRAPIGFISMRPHRQTLAVDLLAVHPNYQGHGVGSRLMRQAERTAARRGLTELILWVDEANGQAQRFYRKHGMETVHYNSTVRCYLLRKDLRTAEWA